MAGYDYAQASRRHRALRRLGAGRVVAWLAARILHRIDNVVYRVSRGRTTFSAALTGFPVVMLTTTRARSGLARTVPLLGLPDGDRVVVIASNYGQRHHPAWYHNLRTNPRAVLVVAGRRTDVRARMLAGEERERWFRRGAEINPGWVQYRQRAANREIPVIMLEPVGTEPGGPGGPG